MTVAFLVLFLVLFLLGVGTFLLIALLPFLVALLPFLVGLLCFLFVFVWGEFFWSLAIKIIKLLSSIYGSTKKNTTLKIKQRSWDLLLIRDFTKGLSEIFPKDLHEWQHWISDIMEDRTRMQSKGMNHRLVSLITFYRLTRFAFHIGIDKVFILATRRATR